MHSMNKVHKTKIHLDSNEVEQTTKKKAISETIPNSSQWCEQSSTEMQTFWGVEVGWRGWLARTGRTLRNETFPAVNCAIYS